MGVRPRRDLRALSRQRGDGGTLTLHQRELYESFIVHEVVHGVMHQNYTRPATRYAAGERDALKRNLVVNAQTLGALVDAELAVHEAILTTLAHSPALLAGDLRRFWQESREAVAFRSTARVAVANPQGRLPLHTSLQPGTDLGMHASPATVVTAIRTKRSQLGDLVQVPIAKTWTSFVVLPVFKDDVPLYALSMSVDRVNLLALIKTRFLNGEVVGIVDRNYRFLARVPDHENRLGTLSGAPFIKAVQETRPPRGSQGIGKTLVIKRKFS